MKKRLAYLAVIGALFVVMGGEASAQFGTSRYFRSGQFTYWTKNDTTLASNVDTLALFAAMQRIIDSLIAARAGTPQRGEQVIRLHANFSNAANDSVNMAVNVSGVYQAWALPYNMYLDRFILHTAQPNGRSPSTFRDDLPPVSPDSALIFRQSRNASFAAGARAAITVYKVPLTGGLSFSSTAGTFYDMIRFDEAVYPTAGTSVQTIVHLTVKKNR